MRSCFERTALLLGEEALRRLWNSRVAVFGVGGVGGYCVEALARSGIGSIEIIDSDTVSESNINRQIIATRRTIGRYKVDAAEERIHEICPDITVTKRRAFFLPENASSFDFRSYDYVVDAVDTVSAKIEIILRAKEAGVPVISSMGAGNRLDPSKFEIVDLFSTHMDPLAKVMRRELKKRGVTQLDVVWSPEPARKPDPSFPGESDEGGSKPGEAGITAETGSGGDISGGEAVKAPRKRAVPGSIAFVPPVAGLIMAGAVVRSLSGIS